MRLTPLDIRKQPFRKVFSGFDPDAVNSFLEQVANEYESLIKQNDELVIKNRSAEERLEQYVKIERTLNQTLLTAQKATDEARVNAQKEAELIIKDAQIRSHQVEDEARQRVYKLENQLIMLSSQRDGFLARFKSLLDSQTALLDTLRDDLGGRETLAEVALPEEADASENEIVV